EDQHAIAAVFFQQLFQQLQLRGRGQGEPLLLPVRLERQSALRGAGGYLNEALPALRAAEADAVQIDEAAEVVARQLIALLFLGREVDGQALDAVFRQEGTGQLLDLAAV